MAFVVIVARDSYLVTITSDLMKRTTSRRGSSMKMKLSVLRCTRLFPVT